jgi:hypothetical protein
MKPLLFQPFWQGYTHHSYLTSTRSLNFLQLLPSGQSFLATSLELAHVFTVSLSLLLLGVCAARIQRNRHSRNEGGHRGKRLSKQKKTHTACKSMFSYCPLLFAHRCPLSSSASNRELNSSTEGEKKRQEPIRDPCHLSC